MTFMHSRAALAAVMMIAAGSSGALAKGGHGGHHRGFGLKFHSMGHHHRHHHPKLYFYTGGCGYYFDRWQDTRSFYWKKQYYVCKGWW
jgi:hypothetical protein